MDARGSPACQFYTTAMLRDVDNRRISQMRCRRSFRESLAVTALAYRQLLERADLLLTQL